jgi:hypothetical protein
MLLKMPSLCAECLGACCKRLECEYLSNKGCSINDSKKIDLCKIYPLRRYYSGTGQELLSISFGCLIDEKPVVMDTLREIVYRYNFGDTKFKVEKNGVYFES